MLKIEWGDESRRYVYTRFPSEWMWQEFHENRLQYEEMLSSVRHRVDFIADLTDTVSVPNNMFANIVNIFNQRLANEGYTIVIGAAQFIQVTFNMFASILPSVRRIVIFVDSMEEALEIVERDRHENSVQH